MLWRSHRRRISLPSPRVRRRGAGRADPLPRLERPGPARRVRCHGLAGRPGADTWPAAPRRRPESPSTCGDTDCRTRRRPNTTRDYVVAVAEGSWVPEAAAGLARRRVVLVGHGFGGMVAASGGRRARDRCAASSSSTAAGEDVGSGTTAAEFLRDLAEPPEMLSLIDAYLDDRRTGRSRSWTPTRSRWAGRPSSRSRRSSSRRSHALERSVEQAIFE